MFINFTTHTEESLCRPVLQGPFPPESVLHRCPRVGQAPDTAHVTGTVTPMASTKHQPLGEMLNGSHCSSTCSSEVFKCEGKGRAQLHKKGKVVNEQPHTGLGLWGLIWTSGAGRD